MSITSNQPLMTNKSSIELMGSNYLYEGKYYRGQITPIDVKNPELGGKLITDPDVKSLVLIGNFTFNLVPLEISSPQELPGKQKYYRGVDYPTQETVDSVIEFIKKHQSKIQIIELAGNTRNPKRWDEAVYLTLKNGRGASAQISPGEFAFMLMDQGETWTRYMLASTLANNGF